MEEPIPQNCQHPNCPPQRFLVQLTPESSVLVHPVTYETTMAEALRTRQVLLDTLSALRLQRCTAVGGRAGGVWHRWWRGGRRDSRGSDGLDGAKVAAGDEHQV